MMDVTAILMGDPGTAWRRTPTVTEVSRAAVDAYHKAADAKKPATGGSFYIGPRGGLLGRMEVNDTIEVGSLCQVRNYARWFRERDMQASFAQRAPATWTLRRLR